VSAIALLLLLSIFVSKLFFDFGEGTKHVLHLAETIIIGIFIGEITLNLVYTDNRVAYLKRNWFYILSVLPMIGVLRGLAIGDSARFAKILGVISESHIISNSPNLLRFLSVLPAKLIFTKEVVSLMMHVKRTDFKAASPIKPAVPVHLYVSPTIEKDVVRGVKKGAEDFVKKEFHRNVVFRKKDFLSVFKREQELLTTEKAINIHDYVELLENKYNSGIHLVITDEPLDNHHLGGISQMVIGKKCVAGVITQSSIVRDSQMLLCSRIVGYHTFAHAFKPCFYEKAHCLHHHMDSKTLGMYSSLMKIDGQYPLCITHQNK